MSETRDEFLYNYYDYMSAIYVYSHVKTYLMDPKRQEVENGFDLGLLILTVICLSAAMFKIAVIIVYFIFFHAFSAFLNFFKSLFKLKFRIDYSSSFHNAFSFIQKVIKRIFSYIIFLFSSCFFYFLNQDHITDSEKTENYMYHFYLHFESILLIQLLCSSFYACRNTKLATINALVIFLLLNIILYFGFLVKEQIENYKGLYEHNEPQLTMNIVFNFIFLLLNGKGLWNFVTYNNNSKYILIYI